MLVDKFDDLLAAQPFTPFRIYTSDGRSLMVKSPEFAWHAPASRIVWIASERGEGRVHMIDLHLVTRFTLNPSKRRGGSRGRRRSA